MVRFSDQWFDSVILSKTDGFPRIPPQIWHPPVHGTPFQRMAVFQDPKKSGSMLVGGRVETWPGMPYISSIGSALSPTLNNIFGGLFPFDRGAGRKVGAVPPKKSLPKKAHFRKFRIILGKIRGTPASFIEGFKHDSIRVDKTRTWLEKDCDVSAVAHLPYVRNWKCFAWGMIFVCRVH